jgi:hypothetical protein
VIVLQLVSPRSLCRLELLSGVQPWSRVNRLTRLVDVHMCDWVSTSRHQVRSERGGTGTAVRVVVLAQVRGVVMARRSRHGVVVVVEVVFAAQSMATLDICQIRGPARACADSSVPLLLEQLRQHGFDPV